MGRVKDFYHEEICALLEGQDEGPTEAEYAAAMASEPARLRIETVSRDAKVAAMNLVAEAEDNPSLVRAELADMRETISLIEAAIAQVSQ